jgi:hypothetical protein
MCMPHTIIAGDFTFQIILESDNRIILNYQSLPFDPATTPLQPGSVCIDFTALISSYHYQMN